MLGVLRKTKGAGSTRPAARGSPNLDSPFRAREDRRGPVYRRERPRRQGDRREPAAPESIFTTAYPHSCRNRSLNVLKHAGPGPASLPRPARFRSPPTLRIEVSDERARA